MTITVTLTTGYREYKHDWPVIREVCDRCEGYGYHLTPSIGEHAYSREEFEESFDDEEREEYFKRGGIYDVRCEECDGANVVTVVDRDAVSRMKHGARLLLLWDRQLDAEAQERANDAYERRMGY